MGVTNDDFRNSVWAETGDLKSVSGSDAEMEVLDRQVMAIALLTDGKGFQSTGRQEGATTDSVRWAKLDDIISGLRGGGLLPLALNCALCQVDASEQVLCPERLPTSTRNWATVPDRRAKIGTFTPRTGDGSVRYALFVPRAVAVIGPPSFVSMYTCTGLPGPRPRENLLLIAAGVMAVLVFLFAGLAINQKARNISWALEAIQGVHGQFPAMQLKAPGDDRGSLPTKIGLPDMQCLATYAASSSKALQSSDPPPRSEQVKACRDIWDIAIRIARNDRNRLLPDYIFNRVQDYVDTRFSIGGALLVMILSMLALVVILGYGIVGTPWGLVVNDRNRLSLALVQAAAWSLLLLPAIAAFASFNAGLSGDALRVAQSVAESKPGVNLPGFEFFPILPQELWAVMGITFAASPMFSALILKGKATGVGTLGVLTSVARNVNQDIGFLTTPRSVLPRKVDARQARLADLFLGEEAGNLNRVDMSRVQMVVITVVLLLVYAQLLFGQCVDMELADLVEAMNAKGSLLGTFPQAGMTFFGLLALSHGTYLVAKGADKSGVLASQSGNANPPNQGAGEGAAN